MCRRTLRSTRTPTIAPPPSAFRPPNNTPQLQLSPGCDARLLLVASEEEIVPEIERVSEGVLNPTAKANRRAYYKQARSQHVTEKARKIYINILYYITTVRYAG